MTATITCEHEGVPYVVDLTKVTALDALVYRQATGEELDVRVAVWIATAPEAPADWLFADRAVLAWLRLRQNGHPDVTLVEVAASMSLLPAPVGAGIDAPEVG